MIRRWYIKGLNAAEHSAKAKAGEASFKFAMFLNPQASVALPKQSSAKKSDRMMSRQ